MFGRLSLRRSALFFVAAAGLVGSGDFGCATTPPCELNSDCTEGSCKNGECIVECREDTDCNPDCSCDVLLARCDCASLTSTTLATSGSGANSSTGTGGASNSSSANSGGNTATSSNTVTNGPGTVSSSSGSASMLSEFELCTGDSDCTSGLSCKSMDKTGKKRCTRSCSSHDNCMADTRCTGGFCLHSDIGRPCSSPNSCNADCLLVTPGYCTDACNGGLDCPNGYGCMGVGSPPKKVCVKAEAYCNTGDTAACLGSSFCDTTQQMIVPGCTTSCTTAAECPQRALALPQWTCDGLLCRRPNDIQGSLEGGYLPAPYYCDNSNQAINMCGDGLHMNFNDFSIPSPPGCTPNTLVNGQANDACLNSCRYKGGCAYGFACVGLGDLGNQRIGLCMPRGLSEPGGACSKNGDCAFGYCNQGTCSRDCSRDGLCVGSQSCVAAGGPSIEGLSFQRCQ